MTQKAGKKRFLMLYVRKSIRLALVLSIGALILVFAMSTTGGFSYFLQKRSLSLTIEESPVDLIANQKHYTFGGRGVIPLYLADTMISRPYVKNVTILVVQPLEVDVKANYSKANGTVCIVWLWSSKPLNLTLSQGESPPFSLNWTESQKIPHPSAINNILVSEDFFNEYNVVLEKPLELSREGEATLKGVASGITPLRLSQLIEELGLKDSAFFAGYDKAKLASLERHPFVAVHINHFPKPLKPSNDLRLPSTFFVKLNHTVFMNPWDVDITINNLKDVGEELMLHVKNASSTYIGKEFNPAFIEAWPTAAILQELSGFININRLTVFAFGVTMAVVGWYFYGMLSQTVITAKVGELQLMRIRGASFKSLSNSVALIVIVASVTGTIVGVSLSYLFTTVVSTHLLRVTITPEDLSIAFGVYSLLIYSLFGFTASLLSQRRVFSQMRNIKLSNEHKMSTAEKGMSFAGTLVLIVAFSLGIIKAICWIFRLNIIQGAQATNPITSALLMLLQLLDRTVLDALGALFLAYALVNLVALQPKILSTTAHIISRTLSKPLASLSKKILQEKSARMVGGMVITSFLIFNVVSAHLGHAGVNTAWTNLSSMVTGADVRIDMQEEAAPYIFQSLKTATNVAGYTQILFVSEADLSTPLSGTPAYIINSTEYTTLVDGIDYSLLSTLKSLSNSGIVVSDFFRDIGVLDQENLVKLGDKELIVMDFISYLPGTFSVPSLERFVVVDANTTVDVDYIVLSMTVLVKVNEYPPEEVVEDIVESLPSNVTKLCTLATRSSAMTEFSQRMSISEIAENVMSLLFVASFVSVAFAIIAIGLIAYTEATERRSLDGLLRTKGVTRQQLLSMIFSEALTFFLFSFAIGIFAGYVMASGYTTYFSATFPIDASPILASELVIQLLTLLVIYLIVYLAPSLYAMRKVARVHALRVG